MANKVFPTQRLSIANAAMLGGAGPLYLRFSVIEQSQDYWCWAAVSSSVAGYFDPTTPWSECAVASAEMGGPCCEQGSTAVCDQPHFLDLALKRVGHFASVAKTPISQQDTVKELSAGRPIGLRVRWPSGAGHFLAIYGIDTASADVIFMLTDPIYGPGNYSKSFLENGHYINSGTWSHYYKVT